MLKYKYKNRYKTTLGILIASQLLATASTSAAPAVPFNRAVADYSAGKYSQAMTEFKQCVAAYPTNAQAHYYLALCYQAQGNRAEARDEFSLVTRYTNGPLAAYAQQALKALGSSSWSPSNSTVAAASTSSSAAKAAGVAQVFDFYTDWWHACKEFEPVWSETERKLRSVQFHRYNAEDPTNAQLVQKYNIHAYPTLVYLDGSGKVLLNQPGAPGSSDDFMRSISTAR